MRLIYSALSSTIMLTATEHAMCQFTNVMEIAPNTTNTHIAHTAHIPSVSERLFWIISISIYSRLLRLFCYGGCGSFGQRCNYSILCYVLRYAPKNTRTMNRMSRNWHTHVHMYVPSMRLPPHGHWTIARQMMEHFQAIFIHLNN